MTLKQPRHPMPGANPVLDAIQLEVMQEKASTLGRLTETFETALGALLAFQAEEGERGAGSGARREALVDAAADALWHFVVQREACGLRNTEAVLREYRVPAVVRLRMGIVRRADRGDGPKAGG